MNRIFRAALCAAFLFSGARVLASQVAVDSGDLRGVEENGVHSFKGIPFAAPPVGELRWAPPAPVQSWEGVREASAFGADCMQRPYPEGSPYQQDLTHVSEDCLSLSVWSAELNPEQPVPVMVWLHGGGFTRGSGSVPTYDGTRLARRGLVIVTLNYRLNIFGYLAHPELSREQGGASGNYGTLDQIAALQWVQRNIASFGGDPCQVTIFGESAGSAAVSQFKTTPLAAGLFQRAIGQSGGFFKPQQLLSGAEASGTRVGEMLGAESVAAMRAVPAEQLLATFSESEGQGLVIRPQIDGRVFPEQALKLHREGRYNKVPTLIGYNKDESTSFARYADTPFLFKDQASFEAGLKDFVGLAAYPFIWAYPEVAGSRQSYLDFFRDLLFGWDMNIWAEVNEAAGLPTYLYFYSHIPGTGLGQQLGAYHASEIAYVFGNGVPNNADDRKVHQILSGYWTNFAKTGDPNGAGLVEWPRYGDNRNYLHLKAAPVAAQSLDRWRMWLWTLVFDR